MTRKPMRQALKKNSPAQRALAGLTYVKHDVITDAEIEACFGQLSYQKKFHSFGRLIQEKLLHVQLISQIEAEHGKQSYHLLKQKLGHYASLSQGHAGDAYALIKDLDIYGYHRAVIALYAVWTSVYHYGPEDASYWDNFYDGLRHGKSRSGKIIGDGFKRLLSEFKYLVTFEKYDESTSRRHVSPIWLHGLPQKHLEHFIESCVLTDALQRHSVEGQRAEWLAMLQNELKLSQVLTLFFKYGGDAAYTLTRALMELRDQWNERGTVSTDVGIPSYMVESFVNVLRHGAVQRQTQYYLKPKIKPPYLALDLGRFLQPFLCVPPRPSAHHEMRIEVTARDSRFAETRVIPTSKSKGERLTVTVQDILVPPSSCYTLKFGKKHKQIVTASPDFMVFNAATGKPIDLYQDMRWPSHLVVLLHQSMQWVSTNGQASKAQSLRGEWQNWSYLHLRQASQFVLAHKADQRQRKFFTKHTAQQLDLTLNIAKPVPYWVHVSNGVHLVSDLNQVTLHMQHGKGYTSLALFKPGKTYALQRNSHFKQGQSLKSWLNLSLAPGLYTLSLTQGMQTVSQRFLFLPAAHFERTPTHCLDTIAQSVSFHLPHLPVRYHGQWQGTEEKGLRLTDPNVAAVKIEVFPDTMSSTFLYLVLRDLRWRRYGHAHLPHLTQMHTDPESFTREALEALPDSRLRIEVEPPVLHRLKLHDDKVPVEIRSHHKTLLKSHYPVRYHNYAYWDVDLKEMAEAAQQIAPDAEKITVGVYLNRFIPIVHIQQKEPKTLLPKAVPPTAVLPKVILPMPEPTPEPRHEPKADVEPALPLKVLPEVLPEAPVPISRIQNVYSLGLKPTANGLKETICLKINAICLKKYKQLYVTLGDFMAADLHFIPLKKHVLTHYLLVNAAQEHQSEDFLTLYTDTIAESAIEVFAWTHTAFCPVVIEPVSKPTKSIEKSLEQSLEQSRQKKEVQIRKEPINALQELLSWKENLLKFKSQLLKSEQENNTLPAQLRRLKKANTDLKLCFKKVEMAHQAVKKIDPQKTEDVWLSFLHTLYHQPEGVYDLMGKKFFSQLSPFGHGHRITANYYGSQTARVVFRVEQTPLDQVFTQNPLEKNLFYALSSNEQKGLSALRLFQINLQEHFLIQRYQDQWALVSEAAAEVFPEPFKGTLVLTPNLPGKLWLKPESYLKLDDPDINLCLKDQQTAQRYIGALLKDIDRYCEKARQYNKSPLITRWLEHRLHQKQVNFVGELGAVIGVLAIIKRLYANIDRHDFLRFSTVVYKTDRLYTQRFKQKLKSDAQKLQMSQNKEHMQALMYEIETVLNHWLPDDLHPWISQKLTVDSIIAECFFHWYINRQIAEVSFMSPRLLHKVFL